MISDDIVRFAELVGFNLGLLDVCQHIDSAGIRTFQTWGQITCGSACNRV